MLTVDRTQEIAAISKVLYMLFTHPSIPTSSFCELVLLCNNVTWLCLCHLNIKIKKSVWGTSWNDHFSLEDSLIKMLLFEFPWSLIRYVCFHCFIIHVSILYPWLCLSLSCSWLCSCIYDVGGSGGLHSTPSIILLFHLQSVISNYPLSLLRPEELSPRSSLEPFR